VHEVIHLNSKLATMKTVKYQQLFITNQNWVPIFFKL